MRKGTSLGAIVLLAIWPWSLSSASFFDFPVEMELADGVERCWWVSLLMSCQDPTPPPCLWHLVGGSQLSAASPGYQVCHILPRATPLFPRCLPTTLLHPAFFPSQDCVSAGRTLCQQAARETEARCRAGAGRRKCPSCPDQPGPASSSQWGDWCVTWRKGRSSTGSAWVLPSTWQPSSSTWQVVNSQGRWQPPRAHPPCCPRASLHPVAVSGLPEVSACLLGQNSFLQGGKRHKDRGWGGKEESPQ